MKKSMVSFLMMAVLATFLVSCVSIQDRQMTSQERAEANIIGSVSASFTSFQFFHRVNRGRLRMRAHTELMRVARQRHGGNIEIRNITIEGRGHGGQFFYNIASILPAFIVFMTEGHAGDNFEGSMIAGGLLISVPIIAGNFQRITVTGDVVLHGARPELSEAHAPAQRIDFALNNAAGTLIDTIPQGSSIAILNVHSADPSAAEFIMVGVEYRLFGSRRFTIVDRIRLEQIRHEQQLHISGEVDDASAVSIGHILGASIVITGSVGSDAMGGWLVLRALDVRTGQVMTMAMQRF